MAKIIDLLRVTVNQNLRKSLSCIQYGMRQGCLPTYGAGSALVIGVIPDGCVGAVIERNEKREEIE